MCGGGRNKKSPPSYNQRFCGKTVGNANDAARHVLQPPLVCPSNNISLTRLAQICCQHEKRKKQKKKKSWLYGEIIHVDPIHQLQQYHTTQDPLSTHQCTSLFVFLLSPLHRKNAEQYVTRKLIFSTMSHSITSLISLHAPLDHFEGFPCRNLKGIKESDYLPGGAFINTMAHTNGGENPPKNRQRRQKREKLGVKGYFIDRDKSDRKKITMFFTY